MRPVLILAMGACVMALALWAYREDDRTRLAMREMERLERAIGREREALAVLDAEWAYLNRPERLRDLARLNDARLRLVPLTAEAFARLDQIPARPVPLGPLADAGGTGGTGPRLP